MIRMLGAVCAANLAAPFIFLLLMAMLQVPSTPLEGLKALAGVVLISVLVLPQLLPFVVPVSLILSFIGRLAGWRARWVFVTGGALIGVGFLVVFFRRDLKASWEEPIFIPVSILTGTICGWIYWRIAIRQTPEKAHAIDPA